MEDERGLAGRIAARLPIDLVPATGVEHTVIVGFYVWVQSFHGRGLYDIRHLSCAPAELTMSQSADLFEAAPNTN
jgi:hypothetical protein